MLTIESDGTLKACWGFFGSEEGQDVLYRVEAQRYSVVIDPDRDVYGTSAPILKAYWYSVRKRTPCGAWLEDRFVNLKANKQWACNTLEEALASFQARKRRQIQILGSQLSRAEEDLNLTRPLAGFLLQTPEEPHARRDSIR